MERTLSIIKPDGVAQGVIGEVVKRLEANRLNIMAMKMIYMTCLLYTSDAADELRSV